MGNDLDLYDQDRRVREGGDQREVTTSDGQTGAVGDKSSFGNLSSGGLY